MGAFHSFTEPREPDLHDAYWVAYQARKALEQMLADAILVEREARHALLGIEEAAQ